MLPNKFLQPWINFFSKLINLLPPCNFFFPLLLICISENICFIMASASSLLQIFLKFAHLHKDAHRNKTDKRLVGLYMAAFENLNFTTCLPCPLWNFHTYLHQLNGRQVCSIYPLFHSWTNSCLSPPSTLPFHSTIRTSRFYPQAPVCSKFKLLMWDNFL